LKIDNLTIGNFRGISRIEARDLDDTIIIAGPKWLSKILYFWRNPPNIAAKPPSGNITIVNSGLLAVIFPNYRPRQIEVIDFHGAQRHYGRENVQGINLSLDQVNQTRSQHTLCNYNSKCNNVKSEMPGSFIRELLPEKAGNNKNNQPNSLIKTLTKVFSSFFPDNEFLGPRPRIDGSLAFPVLTQNNTEHDLDELSSVEK
jgi:hypothetical protein